ncbi:DUF4244 domain-containing protein [Pseudonocardiaceae bacterium YIM PH 21723]|nr:DUF4244 domain-containing protein [Pseudonocardiaceae bacterium YIM PH 21723]
MYGFGVADDGGATVEYALTVLAAALFAGVLIAVVGGGSISAGLTALINKALAVSG